MGPLTRNGLKRIRTGNGNVDLFTLQSSVPLDV